MLLANSLSAAVPHFQGLPTMPLRMEEPRQATIFMRMLLARRLRIRFNEDRRWRVCILFIKFFRAQFFTSEIVMLEEIPQ
ncbi:MAG: hypothetical protein ACRD28_09445 [Acidobacteriaceae bacterium]